MIRSLFTGISGLRAHQQMLDVTSNNIANVNTTGFKSSSTVFEDTLSQTVAGAGAPGAATGGTNAKQVGLGVQLAATQTSFTEGSNQFTGRTSDLRINGDGFFVLTKGGQETYSRAGSFSPDAEGNLVSPDGAVLQSTTGGPININGGYTSWSISPAGVVNAVDATGATVPIATIALATFANPAGLVKVGETQFQTSINSGAPQIGNPGEGGRGSMTSGYLEMSNVDLASELTNLIISQRGFQANSRVITTSDEVLQSLINIK
ncbi:flagellar hook-basal body complex protein [Rhodococcus sp. X156]|uniref:flagellar hook-basal body complex protein n=1 Tax=Rhodococcus sp. X156 TaxID=2499145 RepID=UPI000FD732D6|nr:flagellar hook-basal body complex protein [Rhodococcus sp. X156]